MNYNKETEIWKDIPEYEGYYQASNMGNVRSVDRTVTYTDGRERFYEGKLLSGSTKNGYTTFRLSINNKAKTFTKSQLVAITFLGHKPNGFTNVVDHISGDKADNRVENLRVVTHRANTSTCFRVDKETLSSKYVGACFNKNRNKWHSSIRYNTKKIHLGSYKCELEASKAYQSALAKINDGTFNPDDYKPKWTSKYKGVTFNKRDKKWIARPSVKGMSKYLGQFNTELEAYEAIQKYNNYE